MTKLLIAGSMQATDEMLDYARRCVQRAKVLNMTIIVGDNPNGVDREVINECSKLNVPHMVYHPTCKDIRYKAYNSITIAVPVKILDWNMNSRAIFHQRDKAMVIDCDQAMFIWNGKSRGTKAGYDYACEIKRTGWLKDFSDGTLQISRS